MLISPEYLEAQKALHARGNYGISSGKWAPVVVDLCNKFQTLDVLDYGCGQGDLQKELAFKIREYDPAIDGKERIPDPADIVVCTDVLEHIEPEYLESVLNDLVRVTKQIGLFTVSLKRSSKTLPDGRNAHLILQPTSWWLPKFMERFRLRQFQDVNVEFMVVVEPLCKAQS